MPLYSCEATSGKDVQLFEGAPADQRQQLQAKASLSPV